MLKLTNTKISGNPQTVLLRYSLLMTKLVTANKDSSRSGAIWLAKVAKKKKALDIVILNIGKIAFFADYFVILSGKNKKQNQAITLELMEEAKAHGLKLLGQEGYKEGSWILLDFGSVIVHIFHELLRSFYDLEFLWSEAPSVKWTR